MEHLLMTAVGARIAVAGSEADAAALRAQAAAMGRSLQVNDSRIAASAISEGAQIMTRDSKFMRFLNAIGIHAAGFGPCLHLIGSNFMVPALVA